jgi:hypothetical protein
MVVSRTGTSTISFPIFRELPGHVTDTSVSKVSSADTPELKLKESKVTYVLQLILTSNGILAYIH